MSVYFDPRNNRYRWSFWQTIDGKRIRLTKLLPRGWSEGRAKRFDEEETARTYARLSTGTSRVPLIDTAVTLYLRERVPKLRDGTNSARNLAHLLEWYEGKGLDQLATIAHQYALKARRIDGEPLEPATARQRLATLRSAAVYAFKKHNVGSQDWIARMELPAVKNDRHYYLTRAQVLQMARACNHPATRALILLTFATGSRPGELHRSEPTPDGFLLPEDKAGNRVLKRVPARLMRYMRHWPMELDYTGYSRRFRAARKAIGLDHIHLHDLRHSTASAIISMGGTLAEAGAVLDNQTAQSTKRYAHLYDGRKREILESLWQSRTHKPAKTDESP